LLLLALGESGRRPPEELFELFARGCLLRVHGGSTHRGQLFGR